MISAPPFPADHDPDNSWFSHAACRGTNPELFFPTRGDTHSLRNAKRICLTCPVQTECLEYALSNPTLLQGVWAGTSERERRRMRLLQNAALRTPSLPAPAREQEPLLP